MKLVAGGSYITVGGDCINILYKSKGSESKIDYFIGSNKIVYLEDGKVAIRDRSVDINYINDNDIFEALI